jgi:GNAT superfamily N-acetyltransferase
VDILVVSPSHQRKGLGKLMLEDGLKYVDAEGARCYIEATVEGLGLYEKLGWKRIGGMEMDLTRFGKGIATRTYLMRDAKKIDS